MKRAIGVAVLLLASTSATAIEVGVDCDFITNVPDLPRKICVGYPQLPHPCAYWAARGWVFTSFPLGPTHPLARIKCAPNWKGSMVSYIAWQTMHTWERPWPNKGTFVTDIMPLALEYTTGQCVTYGVQLP